MAVPSPQELAPDATKDEIRRIVRQQRRRYVCSLESSTRHALEEKLADLLAPMLAAARVIGAYSPIGGEISPAPALARAKRLGRTIAYPTFEDDLARFIYRAGEPDIPGPHRIEQPRSTCPEASPDLVLVPLLAVGNRGYRLGQGKGHFDRVLPTLSGARFVGIGWQMQRLDRDLPHDDWDVPLHCFASPRGIEEFD
ncbi:5-formyltetrahydrofolate cyclo-ligase [Sphingomicrobium astaxanthinifaciens]|uniref:5-formyltetrahydrofolate cyclo-ligase n=1 Tax=Sphingomicrobium astaxanthinifaciens TaxID=1227949 RepID=UPI001FCC365F|nr:5-formyltetrahydrofolate cyclo-ligase [Sphingomicrobium astaxanthinifaciens]MCJ7422132.1 5-formyltetrahydrofolate cyclo-ligase [Sphingomicrobium astaxanthinifaciens]